MMRGDKDMTQNERVKAIRKELHMTMDAFGARLGVGKTAISKIENGERNLTDQMAKAICREFNVSEEWLRTGEGDMFQQTADDYIMQKCREHGFTDREERLLRLLVNLFLKMTPDQREYLSSELMKIAGRDPEDLPDPVSSDPSSLASINAKVEDYRRVLLEEQEAPAKSSPSSLEDAG